MYIRTGLFILSLLFLFGCTNNSTTEQRDEEPLIEQITHQDEVTTNENIAQHLANIASEVPDVDQATAVVAGPYAVVGIDVDETLERQRVGTIKFSVSEALRDDPYGKTAVVVADADTTERIRKMRDHIQNGKPIHGIVDELAEIVGRFMPTFPVEEQQNEDIEHEQGTISDDGTTNHDQDIDR